MINRNITSLIPSSISGLERPTNLHIYVGSTDPQCYHQYIYDVWPFSSDNYETYCKRELLKLECTFVDVETVTDKMVGLRDQITLTCLGIKGSSLQISHDLDNNWIRLTSLPYNNVFGPIHYYMRDELYHWVTPMVYDFGLTFNGSRFFNAALKGSRRQWLSTSHFIYSITKSHQLMFAEFPAVWPGDVVVLKRLTYASRLHRSDCSVIYGYVTNTETNPPLMTQIRYDEVPKDTGLPLRMGTPQSFGLCPVKTRENLIHNSKLIPSLHNQEKTWYQDMFKWLFTTITGFVSTFLQSVLGYDWQTILVVVGLTHYLSTALTGNPIVGLMISIYALYYSLNFH